MSNAASTNGLVASTAVQNCYPDMHFNHLKKKRRLLYLKPQSVPRCKHFLSQL